MHNLSYENESNLHVNEISFSYEKMGTKTPFEEEAKVIRKWPIQRSKVVPRLLSADRVQRSLGSGYA